MMKFFFMLLMLMPLSFLNNFWIMQFFFFIITFMFMLNYSFNFLILNLSFFFGLDLLSFSLILLSLWICSLMIMASEKLFKFSNFDNLFLMVMIILLISLLLTFSSLNLFIFYLFFEVSLIPTLILIMGWGYQPERIEAGMYLLFYTLLVSLPMMISIFMYYENFNSLSFSLFFKNLNFFFYLCMNMIFLLKMPMFFVHLWLPKAHVEASVAGSMILAGIMLKLGGYGLMRLMILFLEVGIKFNLIFMIISLIGGLVVSLICICLSDMKMLIAYSSVAHMGLVLAGIMTLNLWGLWGSLIMMLAHGLCSSGLFCLANMSYERIGSRSLYLNKGLLNIMPSLSLWWFMLCICNMSAPPSLSLLGEIVLINSLVSYSFFFSYILFMIAFFSAVYSLFLYSFSQHGMFNLGSYMFIQVEFREYLLLFLHWFPLNFLILKAEFSSLWI
nr:NADH dehydrogenase subunit 4 [Ulochaetes vacca]